MADDSIEGLLRPYGNQEYPTITRATSTYNPLHTYDLPKGETKGYQQQYGDIYFVRLAKLKPAVEEVGNAIWEGVEVLKSPAPSPERSNANGKIVQIAGDQVRRVDRVLDVRQGDLCWVVGTIYMDMPLKPNILDDISQDHWISAPPPREKFVSPSGEDQIMLEDDSGRLRLTGTFLQTVMLVTGCIVAVMGTENANGEFEVLDLKAADLPHQPARWERDDKTVSNGGKSSRQKAKQNRPSSQGKIALVSGLGIGEDETDNLRLDLLMEYLLGDSCGEADKAETSEISRLVIAGNSLGETAMLTAEEETSKVRNKKFRYDSSAYNPIPTAHLDDFLSTLLPSLPITVIPGDLDPANVSLPQQPIHPALFPLSRAYAAMPGAEEPGWFDMVSNPWMGDLDGWRMFGTGGQTVSDIFKYVEGDERLDMMENMLRWRSMAPTAPDTLWCYPFQDDDPFVIEECPHVYFAGNQPSFGTRVIQGPDNQEVTLISIPAFKDTGEVVLLDMDSLRVEVIKIDVLDEE